MWRHLGFGLALLCCSLFSHADTPSANSPCLIADLPTQGTRILVEVSGFETIEQRLDQFGADAVTELNKRPVIARNIPEKTETGFIFSLLDADQTADAISRIEKHIGDLTEPIFSYGDTQRVIGEKTIYRSPLEIKEIGDGVLEVAMSPVTYEAERRLAIDFVIQRLCDRLDPDRSMGVAIRQSAPEKLELYLPLSVDIDNARSLITERGALGIFAVEQMADEPTKLKRGQYGRRWVHDPLMRAHLLILTDPIITNSDISSINMIADEDYPPTISIILNPTAAQKFGDATVEYRGEVFAIVLDDTVLMTPRIMEPIYGGNISMSGGYSVAEAERLERLMSSGDLMADVTILEEGVIGGE